MAFVRIAPGEFMMGSLETERGRSRNEAPHRVRITRSFFLAMHETTVDAYGAFSQATNRPALPTVDDKTTWRSPGFPQAGTHPVIAVSWNDAVAFCAWLSQKEGRRYRLPTEAEWEYACRAGTKTAYSWGADPDGGRGRVNWSDNARASQRRFRRGVDWLDGFPRTSPVGTFPPNAWGLFDMHGNAWEWCADLFAYHLPADSVDPPGPPTGDSHLVRGGSWAFHPSFARSACRGWHKPDERYTSLGFRVAADAP